MYTIDQVQEMLCRIADEIPEDFYKGLNGGIVLLEETLSHPESRGDLFILGQYHKRHDMGRSINIYYGSFMRLHGHLPEEELYEKLRSTLLHEFTHHLESLSGERDLEIKDEIKIHEYKSRVSRNENNGKV